MEKTNTTPGTLVRHFKGTLMKILHRAHDARDQKEVVVYVHLDDGRIWTRPVEEFDELVAWPDGVHRKRFIVAEGQ